jgi:hypothetical protein
MEMVRVAAGLVFFFEILEVAVREPRRIDEPSLFYHEYVIRWVALLLRGLPQIDVGTRAISGFLWLFFFRRFWFP